MNRIAVTVDPERVEIVLDGLAGAARRCAAVAKW
jgi:hypothetical protein